MPRYRAPFSDLGRRQLESLLIRTAAHAVRRLGSRAGYGPHMDPEELTQRALVDTMEERRRWDPERCSLDRHLAGCINSYISHYFESRENRVQIPPRTNGAGNGTESPEHRIPDVVTPEANLESARLAEQITEFVQAENDPLLSEAWTIFETEGWDLKRDGRDFCLRLGLDPATGGADYQKFNRIRNRLRNIASACLENRA